jgi:integrase
MGRPTIPGVYRDQEGRWHVDKVYRSHRLRQSFGADYGEAEGWLLAELARLRAAPAQLHRYTFDQAAAHYITLYESKASLEQEIDLLKGVMPHIGQLFLDQIYDATLKPFIDARKRDGVKSKTINLALGVVRHILNLAARSWRDDDGRTWLVSAPLISMVEGGDEREPRQLTWQEQRENLHKLPDHLARMALFDLNCGARDAVVCGLKWEWEIQIPELGFSVFNVPRPAVKGKKRSRILVCNSVAQSVIESVRGQHDDYAFVYSQRRKNPKYRPIETMNNTAWQGWRDECGLGDLHVHDLRHTVGSRLREAGVAEETRADILWHVRRGMPQHYAVAQVIEIREALERITDERHAFNKSLATLAREAAVPAEVPMQRKSG